MKGGGCGKDLHAHFKRDIVNIDGQSHLNICPLLDDEKLLKFTYYGGGPGTQG